MEEITKFVEAHEEIKAVLAFGVCLVVLIFGPPLRLRGPICGLYWLDRKERKNKRY